MIARAAVLAVLGLSAALSSAAADPLWPGRPVPAGALPPYEVITIIRSAGFSPLRRPVLRGPDYVVRAIDRIGTDVRVRVDARSGRIVSALPLDALPYRRRAIARYAPPPAYGPDEGPYGYPPPRGAAPPRPYAYEPPNGPENGRAPAYEPYLPEEGPPPSVPQHSAALSPPKTPLPRPRPAQAPAKSATASVAETHGSAPQETAPAKSESSANPKGNESSPPAATAMPPVAPLE